MALPTISNELPWQAHCTPPPVTAPFLRISQKSWVQSELIA